MRKVRCIRVKGNKDVAGTPACLSHSASQWGADGIWVRTCLTACVCSMNCRTCAISGKCPSLKVNGLSRNSQEHTTNPGREPLCSQHPWITGPECQLITKSQRNRNPDDERAFVWALMQNGVLGYVLCWSPCFCIGLRPITQVPSLYHGPSIAHPSVCYWSGARAHSLFPGGPVL